MLGSDEVMILVDLCALSEEAFIAGWRALVGEPPAVMLEDRKEMVALLVEGSPVAPCALCWPL